MGSRLLSIIAARRLFYPKSSIIRAAGVLPHYMYSTARAKQDTNTKGSFAFKVLLGAVSTVVLNKCLLDNQVDCATKVYSREEVRKRNSKETGIWVIYENKVFDITEFVDHHPGGPEKIMLAAGGNLEPFWDMYAIHKQEEVIKLLHEHYLIGELKKEDRIMRETKRDGPFANDPKRHLALLQNSLEPFNAETPSALATDNLITPNELFFVRNHLPVPVLKADEEFVIEGIALKSPVSMSVNKLKESYDKTSVTAAMQCAGNRREEMNKVKKVKGLSWGHNAMSNAVWSGVLLKDLLLSLGVDENDSRIKHIHFEGADVDPTGSPYGASIPVNRVFQKNVPVLIAYEMNGTDIPRDHGFPLRLIAPGIVGARNVKWLKKIVLSEKEYPGHWQQNDYKPFSPNIDWDNVDFKKSPAIQELPVTSAICSPSEGSVVDAEEEEVNVKGYAFSGGGRGIIRVDLSVDGGSTWITADLTQAEQGIDDMYSWTLWQCTVPIPPGHSGEMKILTKAVDSSCNTQPDSVAPVWNLRGVLNNSWHCITLKVL